MNGILSVLKPPGMTSHDVVSQVRKITGIKKVGHTGTLDPGAAGVLPICIGKATKIVDFIMDDIKTYICELTLGNKTDTYDKYGSLVYDENQDCSSIDYDKLMDVIHELRTDFTETTSIFCKKN
jgi:tRNA pseudouridine55 synthase